jgi:branched-chain amino acid transport system ATP-binding protein
MSAILEVRGVLKSFGAVRAVDDVSLSVEHGEIYGIAGPNGAGKTTLFNLITGIPFGPDEGTIWFDGQPIQRSSGQRICHLGIARTFQAESVFDTLTVDENVRVAATYGGRHGRAAGAAIRDALESVSLWDERHRRADQLPLYAKKRLMLASAFATRPRLLLLDEPASGLDEAEQRATHEILRRANEEGLTIVLIEHVLPFLTALSIRVMILDRGRTLIEATPEAAMRDEAVVAAYLGPEHAAI